MKLTSPFTILRDVIKNEASELPTCSIDETEVAIKECMAPIEEKMGASKLDFWDKECEEHPTNSHCKVFDE